MTVDWTVNIANIIAVAIIVGGGIAAWVTLRNRVDGHAQKLTDTGIAISAQQATHKMLSGRVEDIRAKSAHELAEFKIEVAKEYATNQTVHKVKDDVVEAISRLGDRLDRIIEGQGKAERRTGGPL